MNKKVYIIISVLFIVIGVLLVVLIKNNESHAFTTEDNNISLNGLTCSNASIIYYVKNDVTGNYEQVNNAPNEEYVVDENASHCDSNNCYMYFDKEMTETVWNFDYYEENGVGKEQTFTAPKSGTYMLEVWGAQGGNSLDNSVDRQGGYGAYAKGNIELINGTNLYIVVGGVGKTCTKYGSTTAGTTTCPNDGGYNGGGITRQYVSTTVYGSGGGATHIATTNRGLLSNYNSYRNEVLIVAGAGGGASYYSNYNARGGNAGGIQGSIATYTKLDRSVTCTGGTQSAAGTGSDTSGQGFGIGGSIYRYVGPGGGSGWFGGGTSEVLSCGGSSYIGNDNLNDKQMVCYNCTTSSETSTKTLTNTCVEETPTENCSKMNNGYARITYIGNN